jgi:hypothetical protein
MDLWVINAVGIPCSAIILAAAFFYYRADLILLGISLVPALRSKKIESGRRASFIPFRLTVITAEEDLNK